MQINSLHLNFAIYNYDEEKYLECIQILTSLQYHFQDNYMYWYRLGMSHFKLFQKEIKLISKMQEIEFQNLIQEDQEKFCYSQYSYECLHNMNPI